ncbi:MAG: Type 1 glutamine amidotransferase-like domain-containing protein [Clostridia bacterium]|nr:Type 1 glutamine amidotransferase-like domain-containing protein [Clostridia bacterium]
MLVLASDGLTSEAVLTELKSFAAECRSAALVVNADPVYKEKNYHVPRCLSELEIMGISAETFDLDQRDGKELLAYDVVEFIGGNPYVLLDSIRRHGTLPVLQSLAREKILIGWSAAAFVFGPTLDLVDRYTPEMNTLELRDLHACGLTDLQVLPHYGKFLSRIPDFEKICAQYEKEKNVSVIRLNDGDAIFLQDGKMKKITAL